MKYNVISRQEGYGKLTAIVELEPVTPEQKKAIEAVIKMNATEQESDTVNYFLIQALGSNVACHHADPVGGYRFKVTFENEPTGFGNM